MNAPIIFFARDRELAEEAYAGDVIGIPNHGALRVGDTLTETGRALHRPAELRAGDPAAGAARRSAEGQAPGGRSRAWRRRASPSCSGRHRSASIVGVVGPLQFEVIQARIEPEYRIRRASSRPLRNARWVGRRIRPRSTHLPRPIPPASRTTRTVRWSSSSATPGSITASSRTGPLYASSPRASSSDFRCQRSDDRCQTKLSGI